MSQPYHHGFDSARSPFDKPSDKTTSPISPTSGQSWKTNVNRSKTKRWVEAKSYSYDGDDWGDGDEYDDYDEPPPAPPASNAARQPDQGSAPVQQTQGSRYGELPQSQFAGPPSARSATNPPLTHNHGRGSFDQGDDRRAFSSGHPNQAYGVPPHFARNDSPYSQTMPSRQTPPPLHVQTQPRPSMDQEQLPRPPYGADPRAGRFAGPGAPPGRRSQSGGRPVPGETYDRQESPNRPMNYPQSAGAQSSREASPAKRYPPRKSSLSQQTNPMESQNPPASANDQPSSAAEQPTGRDRAPSSGAKPLPFIRPADIYRRMEEEREKERRQSQESSRRPSMESTRHRSGPDEGSPVPSLPRKSSSESMGRSAARRPSLEGPEDVDTSRRLQPMLQPVAERKSEYGFENMLGESAQSGEGVATPRPAQHAFPTSTPHPQENEPASATSIPDPMSASSNYSGQSIGSSLPESSRPDVRPRGDYAVGQHPSTEPATSLQHNPSLGFHSVVHQAFDQPDGRDVPQTPSSAGDSVIRSNSASTSQISPIISRNTSAVGSESRTAARDATPTISEEPAESRSRPTSSGTWTQDTPQGTDSEPLPPTFRPGHRRDASTPSPGNSPARKPKVETGYDVPKSALGELGSATLTDTRASTDKPLPIPNLDASISSQPLQRAEISVSGSESPSKSSAKGLASRFETQSSPRGSRSDSPVKEQASPRPTGERLESFRPALPGGWTSYVTNTGPPSPSKDGGIQGQPISEASPETPIAPRDASQYRGKTSVEPKEDKQKLTTDPFAAAAAAGSALAGAFAAATGVGKGESDDWSHSGESSEAEARHVHHEHGLIPPKPPYGPTGGGAVSATSSAPPTPPPKDTPLSGEALDSSKGYFAAHAQEPPQSEKATATPPRPLIIANMSTETSPQDTESDRLRKEIMRTLSPQTSHNEESVQQDQQVANPGLDIPPTSRGQVESTVLPSEYESYWNEGPQDEDATEDLTRRPIEAESPTTPVAGQSHQALHLHDGPPAPLEDKTPTSSTQPRPLLKQRFSWEADSEEQVPQEQDFGIVAPLTPRRSHEYEDQSRSAVDAPASAQPPQPRDSSDAEHTFPVDSVLPIHGPDQLAAEPTPDEADHTHDRVSPIEQQYRESTDEFRGEQEPSSTVVQLEPETQEVAPIPQSQQEVLSFREILQMKTPYERISAYNATRDHFAGSETGLDNWIQRTSDMLPEHADVINANGRLITTDTVNSPARSKFPRLVSLGGTFHTPEGGSDGSRPSHTRSTSGAFGAGKISTQQVQDKGKDILHSAGKFSGKAGGAAKGLFAKGRSRFRNSGGGDKAIFSRRRKSQPIEAPSQHSLSIPFATDESEPLPPAETSDDPHLASVSQNEDSDSRAFSTEELNLASEPDVKTKAVEAAVESTPEANAFPHPTVPVIRAPEGVSPQGSPSISEHIAGTDSAAGHSSGVISEVEQETEADAANEANAIQTTEKDLASNEDEENTPTKSQKADDPTVGEGGLVTSAEASTSLPSSTGQQEEPGSAQLASEGDAASETPEVKDLGPVLAVGDETDIHRVGSDDYDGRVSDQDASKPGLTDRVLSEPIPEQTQQPEAPPLIGEHVPHIPEQGHLQPQSRGLLASNAQTRHRSISPLPSGNVAEVQDAETDSISPPPVEDISLIAGAAKAAEASQEPQRTSADEAPPAYRSPIDPRPPSSEKTAEWGRVVERPKRDFSNVVPVQSRPFSFVDEGTEVLNRRISQGAQEQPKMDSREYQEKTRGDVPDSEEKASLLDRSPKSYSRPFQDPRLEDHPAYRLSQGEIDRSMVYSTESHSADPYSYRQSNQGGQAFTPLRQSQYADYHQRPIRGDQYAGQPANGYSLPPSGPTSPPQQSYDQSVYGPNIQYDHVDRAYLPRPQATEYQLPGVGPPPMPSSPPKTKSGPSSIIFRSRSKSQSGVAPDDESESFDQPEPKSKRRSSLFRTLNGPKSDDSHGQSRAKSNAHGSSDDFLQTASPRAYDANNSYTSTNKEMRPAEDKKKNKRLQRAQSSNFASQETGKKKGFSRLSGLFGRSGTTGSKPSGPSQHIEQSSKPQKLLNQRRQQQQQQQKEHSKMSPPSQQRPPSIQQSPPPQQVSASPPQNVQRWSTLSNLPNNSTPGQTLPSRQMSVPTQSFSGQPPPIGGYYAPQPQTGRPAPSPDFLGGRRLSERRLAESKHNFESQNGFRGPFHPSLQPQGYPPILRINTQYDRRGSSQPQQVKSAQPRLEPSYGRSPYGSNSRGRVPDQESQEYARDLHRRSRSPRAGPHSPSLDDAPDSAYHDPAYTLGTFRNQNNSTPRLGDQEKPWSLSIPEDGNGHGAEIRRLTNYGGAFGDPRSAYPVPPPRNMTSGADPAAKPTTTSTALDATGESLENKHLLAEGASHEKQAPVELQGSRVKGDDESEEIVMSSTAYPGQEWMPENFGQWEGD